MIALSIILVSALISFQCFRYFLKEEDENFLFPAIVCLLPILILLLSTASEYYDQINDIESVKMYESNKQIYEDKASVLTKEFTNYLALQYPKYEKSIFHEIEPLHSPILYFVKYPEIQASKPLMELVSQISKLQSDVYEQDINKQKAEKDMRRRLRNSMILNFLLPSK